MARAGAQGASLAAMGHADIALYEGRADDAVRALEPAIATDDEIKNTAGKATKEAALAEALEVRGEGDRAVATALQATKVVREPAVLVPAARLLMSRRAEVDVGQG